MKNKLFLAALCSGILSMAGLLFLSVYAMRKDYQDLILVVPDGTGLPALDLNEINKLCTEELTVTYDVNKRVTAAAANTTMAFTLVGTNDSYVNVMGLKMAAGSFWSGEAWAMRSRYVVLNEPAAFRLFGSSNIIGNTVKFDGEVWLVTGIVKDGYQKRLMAYVPASAITGQPEVLMAKTPGGTAAVMNSLRSLEVYESNCRAVDAAAAARLFWQLFTAAVYIGTALAAILFFRKQLFALSAEYEVLRLRYQTMYPDELVKKSSSELKRMIFISLQLILSIAAVFFLARQILTMVLEWKEIGTQHQYLTDYFFAAKMQWLVRYFVSGPILFSGFIMALIMAGISMLFKNADEYDTINGEDEFENNNLPEGE